MSEKQYTTVSIPADAQPLTKQQLRTDFRGKKKKGCCTIQRLAVIAIVGLVVIGLSAQVIYVDYKLAETTKNYQILQAAMTNQSEEISFMKDFLFADLTELDVNIVSEKLIRRYRHLERIESKYAGNLGFFASFPNVLDESGDFNTRNKNVNVCPDESMLISNQTGQIWCRNKNSVRADSFYNTYTNPGKNMDSHSYRYLGAGGMARKSKQNYTSDYYLLEKNSKIIIKQSGIYIVFSKITFDVYKGMPSYAVWKDKEVLGRCRLMKEVSSKIEFEYIPCTTFTIAYLEEGDEITMRITANTKFRLGEKQFFIGLYHMTSLQL